MPPVSRPARFGLAAALFLAVNSLIAFSQTVTVSPSTLAFGNQVVNTTAASRQITLKNGLSTPLTITSITSSLADFVETSACPISPATLRAGASCLISVTFTPSALGSRSGTLKITDNASNSPQVVSLKGFGVVAVSVTPATISFGNQALGTSSAATKVTVLNNQATALTISNIATSLSDFQETTTCPLAPGTLAAGGSCTVSVTFKPSVLGNRTATLSVTDDAITSPQTVSLTGKGTAAVLTSIAVTPNPASIVLGTQQQFTATGTYSNSTTKNITNSVTWTSSSTIVATVGSSGLATGTGQGTANITAISGTVSGLATLQVTSPPLVSLLVTPTNASIPLGTSQQFTATGTYGDGSSQNLTSSVSWTSSVPVVAAVSNSGLATSLSQGTTTIAASTGTLSSSAILSVGPPVLNSISVTPANPSFALGTTQPLKATATYSDGSTWDVTGTAAWTSANSTIASVNNQGLVSGAATGSSSITASLGSITGSTTVTVTSAALVSIAVTPAIPVIPIGATQPFIATGTYTDGTTQDITTTAQWSSDTPTVAAISNQAGSQGVATGVTAGAATISATAGTVKGITVLTVSTANLVSIAVTPAVPSIAQGTLQQFTATATYSDGSKRDLTSSATWSSDTVSTATINNTGLANGVGPGTATISALSGSVTGSTVLTVTSATLLSIAVIPQTPSIAPGTTQQFAATGTFSDGTTQDLTPSGYWNSSAASIATISDAYGSQGLAASVGAGTTTILVVSGTISGTATLTVNPSTLVSIAVNPQSALIALGAAQQCTATGTYSDGSTQDLTRIVNWHSSSAAVAVVSNTSGTVGLATSAGDGSTNILATLGQVSSSAQLTVGQPVLVSIVIAPTNVSIPLGTTQQFQATGTFSDGSMQDVTSSVAWASSAPSVASIAAGGLASAIGAGSATVSATSGSITNSTQVTVTAPILVSLSVSPSAASIPVLSSQQYSATGTYSDGSTQILTNSVTWTSSPISVATIGSTGLASSGSAGISTITASSGSINATGSLSVGVGSVSGVTSITCPSGFSSGSQCSQATVSCPSTADLQATWGVKQGSGAGTIIIFSGAAGTTASGNNYVTPLNGAGFTTVQTAWGSDWQDTGLSTKSILTAACRPAAIGKYIHDNIYSTGGFGVLGGSAGAGTIAYWLAWYGGGDLLDSAELASGPPYSDIEQGCEKPNGSSVNIIPTDGTPWVDAINFRGGPQNGVTTETGYTCQPSKGNTTQAANTAWLAQSIVQPGWISSYPETSVAGWVCNNALNNSEAEGYLFYSQLSSPYSLTAISGCVGTEIVDSGYTPEGVLGLTAVSNDMIAHCVKKHFD